MINLMLGKCEELMQSLPNESIDLTVTSPPYDNLRTYRGFTFDFETVACELYRITKLGGVVVWVVGDATINGNETGTSFRQALFFKELGFNLHDTMIYQKAGTGACGSNLTYWQTFEYMFILSKGRPKTVNRLADKPNARAGGTNTRGRISATGDIKDTKRRVTPEMSVRSNVWRYLAGNNGDDKVTHPAKFPETLARDHILSWSNEGDDVFDPFLGSGTTGKMAKLSNRNFIGIELSPEYYATAWDRIYNLTAPSTRIQSNHE